MFKELPLDINRRVSDVITEMRNFYNAHYGELDNSSHESYGRIKDAEERAEALVKPLGKTLKEY
jgi:hypothetical protein